VTHDHAVDVCVLLCGACSVRTMTGGGAGGPLPVLKSANDLNAVNHSPSPDSVAGRREVSMHSTGGSSESSLPQGQDAVMSASGFVHAQGEHVSSQQQLSWLTAYVDVHLHMHASAFVRHSPSRGADGECV
jgi:hypothetical protein